MKAILVIDMPTTCEECELDKLYNDIRVYCDHPFREGKNPSCPLRPLPEHLIAEGFDKNAYVRLDFLL